MTIMYETYYGLQEKPFGITPDPRFLFMSRTHREAFAHLLYGLRNKVGFIAVAGEVGAGKTTILRALFSQLDDANFRLALILNPRVTPMGLLQSINAEFGLPGKCRSIFGLVEELNAYLLNENLVGRTPVLIIDEAQNLSVGVLEQIRLLSNLETERDKLIQIVLVGQPELRDLLLRPNLRQLNQRIVVRCNLASLEPDETVAYVRHRLQIAGRADGMLFSEEALKAVHRCSAGLPRRINMICDRALLIAYTENLGQVGPGEIGRAVGEVDEGDPDGYQPHRYKGFGIFLAWLARPFRRLSS
jgi:general secretion pathway protein A